MNHVGLYILSNTAWLYTRIYEHSIFFLDLWSVAHFWNGFMFYCLLRCRRAQKPWRLLLALLVCYELLELLFIHIAFHAFRIETLKDQLTDIVVGLLGGALGCGLALQANRLERAGELLRRTRWLRGFSVFFAGMTVSFIWVGHYQYRYNFTALNSPGLNWWAFIVWATGIMAILKIFATLETMLRCRWLSLLLTWAFYIVTLFAVEFIGYKLLGIHEIGHTTSRPLVGDLIHGTQGLFAVYLSFPLVSVLGFLGARRFFGNALGINRIAFETTSRHAMPDATLRRALSAAS